MFVIMFFVFVWGIYSAIQITKANNYLMNKMEWCDSVGGTMIGASCIKLERLDRF